MTPSQQADAQRAFRARCRLVLREAYAEADRVSTAIGTISVDEAYTAWVTSVRLMLDDARPVTLRD